MNPPPKSNPPACPYSAYLFAFFAGEKYPDGEQVYFAVSRDGLNWQDLNGNRPVLHSTVGAKGVRDPFVIRSVTGDRFWILATDERIFVDQNWQRAQTAASRNIVIWDSPDLVHWSEPRLAPVAPGDAGCTWAPEATFDRKTGEYLVYWASTIAADHFRKQRIYCVKTTDFRTFTPPEIYIEDDKHVIDTTIIEHEGVYYRYMRRDTRNCILADCVPELQSRNARPIPAPFLEAQSRVEGPFIFKFNNQHKWCLLLDNHVGIGYYPLVTINLASGVFHLPSATHRMPTRARHGGVLAITDGEYNALLAKWGVSPAS